MSLKAFITNESAIKLNYYYEEYVIKDLYLGRLGEAEAMVEYCGSDEYNLHLTYLIETWKNWIDEDFDKIDYNHQGTFEELYNYFVDTALPVFNNEWLEDIFERHILDTPVYLK